METDKKETLNLSEHDKFSFKRKMDVLGRFINTGFVMFKFDNDEPDIFKPIYKNGKVEIVLQEYNNVDKLTQEGSNSVTETVTSIEFVSKNGKRFTLYVEKF